MVSRRLQRRTADAQNEEDYRSEGDEEGSSCEDDEENDKLRQQNAALCRNFDELKELHIQLTKANTQLQKACTRLQDEPRCQLMKRKSNHWRKEMRSFKQTIKTFLKDYNNNGRRDKIKK